MKRKQWNINDHYWRLINFDNIWKEAAKQEQYNNASEEQSTTEDESSENEDCSDDEESIHHKRNKKTNRYIERRKKKKSKFVINFDDRVQCTSNAEYRRWKGRYEDEYDP